MHPEHFIPGKDASLEATIVRLQDHLASAGYHVEEHAWLNPVEGVWSVHLRERDCPLMFTNGKGGSMLAARASALGEFFERASCNAFWNRYYLGRRFAEDGGGRGFVHYPNERWFQPGRNGAWPTGLLTPTLQAFYNPNDSIPAERLIDFNSGNAERGICAIPYVRQRDGATVYFPVKVIANLYVSNGMSAGNTPHEAQAQALSEILERHVRFRVIAEGLCLPDVPDEVIVRYPRIAAGIAALRAAGFGILVKDASLGGMYPVMNVTLLHPADQGCFARFGAHPRFAIALERALTGLLQGRALEALAGFHEPGFDLDEIASAPNLEMHFVDSSGILHWNFLGDQPDFAFHDWNFGDGTTAGDHAWLIEALHAEGHDVHVAEFAPLGVHACRVLVPGVSEIYPIDALEFDNDSVGNTIREAVLNLAELDDDECADLLDTLIESRLTDERPVAALIGLAPGSDPFWSELRVGELKALLGLAVGDVDAITEGCEWVRHCGQLDAGRRRVYRCIEAMVKLEEDTDKDGETRDLTGFLPALKAMFGEDTLTRAEALLAGELRFFGQPSPGLDLEGCDLHQRLLDAYAKLHSHK